MTEWYFHFDPSEFTKAMEVQEALLCPDTKKPQEPVTAVKEPKTKAGRRGSVLPFPAKETGKKRKQA